MVCLMMAILESGIGDSLEKVWLNHFNILAKCIKKDKKD
jgi:hypothetical protein